MQEILLFTSFTTESAPLAGDDVLHLSGHPSRIHPSAMGL